MPTVGGGFFKEIRTTYIACYWQKLQNWAFNIKLENFTFQFVWYVYWILDKIPSLSQHNHWLNNKIKTDQMEHVITICSDCLTVSGFSSLEQFHDFQLFPSFTHLAGCCKEFYPRPLSLQIFICSATFLEFKNAQFFVQFVDIII